MKSNQRVVNCSRDGSSRNRDQRSRLQRKQAKQLIAAACEARKHAYAPYSKFRVGAALLSADGRVFTGCNVENASYGLTICAERVALGNAIAQGAKKFVAIAVVYDAKKEAVPCGACRQVLREFGEQMVVLCATTRGTYTARTVSELLPASFGPEQLSS